MTEVTPVVGPFVQALHFKNLFCVDDGGAALKQAGLSGKLRNTGIRSIAWRYFLSVLPNEVPPNKKWLERLEKDRARYKELLDEFQVDPHNHLDDDPTLNNPLSQAEDSAWNIYFQNTELEKTINQDIDRTYPDQEFFQQRETKEMMLRILFIYARQNPSLSYRQGMHELLAPILYLLHTEDVSTINGKENGKPDEEKNGLSSFEQEVFSTILDPKYKEHDAFLMLNGILATTAPWFSTGNPPTTSTPKRNPNSLIKDEIPDESNSNPAVMRCRRIQHVLLKQRDNELYSHLESLKIEPHLYMLRWIRLLLGREFHLEDLLLIWDALFAYSADLSLVDYICVAMLIYIRTQLLERDFSGCLTRLFKYPPVEDVGLFVEQGITLASPSWRKAVINTQQIPTSPIPHHTSSPQSILTHETPIKEKKHRDRANTPTQLPPLNAPVQTFKEYKETKEKEDSSVQGLKAEIKSLKDTQQQMSSKVEQIVATLQKAVRDNPSLASIDAIIISLAQLKQTRDILCGDLPPPPPLWVAQSHSEANITHTELPAPRFEDPLGAISSSPPSQPNSTLNIPLARAPSPPNVFEN